MTENRKEDHDDAMGLSFLDILCCGLGAAILLLLIVKHDGSSLIDADLQLMAYPRIAALEQLLNQKLAQVELLNSELEKIESQNDDELDRALDRWKNIDVEKAEIARLQYETLLEENRLEALKTLEKRLADRLSFEAQKDSSVLTEKVGALKGIGLAGEDKVVILLDVSASMLHWSLVEIIRLQASGAVAIKNAPKWNQAILAAQFAYQTLDKGARFKIIRFSEFAYDTDDAEIDEQKIIWELNNGKHDKLVSELSDKLPKKGTNLQVGFDAVNSLVPRPERILLITDGLPGKISNRHQLKGCPRNTTRVVRVSGECRTSIAIESVRSLGQKLSKVPIDVILLPLEGDREAIRFYSLLTGLTAGKLITPSVDWLIK
ncbi:hypothetical protein PQY67_04770 [Pseudomonadales bacterium]|nr:hypothetical protein [Pseudomonadales bacterium]